MEYQPLLLSNALVYITKKIQIQAIFLSILRNQKNK